MSSPAARQSTCVSCRTNVLKIVRSSGLLLGYQHGYLVRR